MATLRWSPRGRSASWAARASGSRSSSGSSPTAEIFGRFSVGSVFGTIFFVHQVGAALGSWLGGFLFETSGGYGAAFSVAAAFLLAACVVSLTIDERPRIVRRFSPVAGGG